MGEHEEHFGSDGAWWLPLLASARNRARVRAIRKGVALLLTLAVVMIAPVLVGSWLAGGA